MRVRACAQRKVNKRKLVESWIHVTLITRALYE